MIKKITMLIVGGLLCLYFSSSAQYASGLKIAEPVPDSFWRLSGLIGKVGTGVNPGSASSLADYKDKLLIIDFWASWCVPCVASLSKLNAMTSEFAGKVAVLPVSQEKLSVQLPFIAARGWKLPFVLDTSLSEQLKAYFPHLTVPHQVWIYQHKVVAITSGESASKENILAVLRGDKPVMHEKLDAVDFDPSAPLYVNGNGGDGKGLLYQSAISGFSKALLNVKNIMVTGDPLRPTRLFFPNFYLARLLNLAAGNSLGKEYIYQNRLLIDLPDALTGKILPPASLQGKIEQWLSVNGLTYNLQLPAGVSKQAAYRYMFDDLNRLLSAQGLICRIEEVDADCYSLEFINSALPVPPALEENKVEVQEKLARLLGRSMQQHVSWLRSQYKFLPCTIIDHTGFSGKLDLEIDLSKLDLATLQASLAKSNLRLRLTRQRVSMLTLRQISPAIAKKEGGRDE
ncbi:TlpA disulfide reductase family protein [Pedobacter sp. SYP-B3415]|uniref:TlpA family protein disulfide reductase n=1 Tax=Pedobacter sp. SYP-B3415 TaxID=2496641 RepID=UPI00101DFD76|nr:TlpA disulfide reductase family protein [Pedobacter sp. SYP-B3415]